MTLKATDWTLIAFNLCFALFECFLIVLLLWRARRAKHVLKPALCVAITHYIAAALGTNVSTVASLLSHKGVYDGNNYVNDDENGDLSLFLIIQSFLFGVMYTMIYLFFMLFLHYSLRATTFRASNIVYVINGVSLSCLWTALICLMSMTSELAEWEGEIMLFANLCFAVSCCHLVFVFNSKLNQVMLMQRRNTILESRSPSSSSGDSTTMSSGRTAGNISNVSNISLNQQQTKLISVMVKMSVLKSWTLIILILFTVIAVMFYAVSPMEEYETAQVCWEMIRLLLVSGWEVIMALVFAMNNDWYFMCCGVCDGRMKRCCEQIAIEKMQKLSHADSTSLHVTSMTPTAEHST